MLSWTFFPILARGLFPKLLEKALYTSNIITSSGIFLLFWSRGQGPVEIGEKSIWTIKAGKLDAALKIWTESAILNWLKTMDIRK